MSDVPPDAAAAAYVLADRLAELRFRAEVAWRAERPDEAVFASVDVCIGRVLQSAQHLTESGVGPDVRDAAGRLCAAIGLAWEDYQRAWLGEEHARLRQWLEETDADPEQEYLKDFHAFDHSPMAGGSWEGLEVAAEGLRAALTGEARTAFDLSCLMAGEVYPTVRRDRAVEALGVTELRYLTVDLDLRVKQALAELACSFAGLGELDPDLTGETEFGATRKLCRLHEAMPRLLTSRRPSAAPDLAPPADAPLGPTAGPAAGVLTFEPGAFIYRERRHLLSGKPLQVLEALAHSRGLTVTLEQLLATIWDGVAVEEDTVRSAVSTARAALREAMKAAGVAGPENPIPTADRGTGRTAWRLDLP